MYKMFNGQINTIHYHCVTCEIGTTTLYRILGKTDPRVVRAPPPLLLPPLLLSPRTTKPPPPPLSL